MVDAFEIGLGLAMPGTVGVALNMVMSEFAALDRAAATAQPVAAARMHGGGRQGAVAPGRRRGRPVGGAGPGEAAASGWRDGDGLGQSGAVAALPEGGEVATGARGPGTLEGFAGLGVQGARGSAVPMDEGGAMRGSAPARVVSVSVPKGKRGGDEPAVAGPGLPELLRGALAPDAGPAGSGLVGGAEVARTAGRVGSSGDLGGGGLPGSLLTSGFGAGSGAAPGGLGAMALRGGGEVAPAVMADVALAMAGREEMRSAEGDAVMGNDAWVPWSDGVAAAHERPSHGRHRRGHGSASGFGAPAAAPEASSNGSGEASSTPIMLDGRLVGHWLSERMARDAGRPGAGTTSFDPRQAPAWTPSGAM